MSKNCIIFLRQSSGTPYYFCIILLLFVFLGKAQNPSGFNLVAYEGFDYTAGSSLLNANGGSGWSGSWIQAYQDQYLKTSTTGFAYTGLTTEGLKAEFDNACYGSCNDIAALGRSIALQSEGVVYIQFISVFEENATGGTPHMRLFNGTTLNGIIGADTGSFMSIVKVAGGVLQASSTAPLNGQNLVVVRIDYNANKTELWVNPDLTTFDYANPTSPAASLLEFSPSFDKIDIFLRSGSIDEISVFKESNLISPFVTTWQTDGTNSVTIPLTGAGYDFTIDWGDGTQEIKTGTPGNISHTYSAAGIKTVSIIPNITTGFPRIYVNNDNALKSYLLTLENWGSGQWGASVDRAFYGAANLEVNATDVPDFSATTNFQYMFLNCTSVTGTNGFTNWSLNTNPAVSVSFSNMFKGATQFNGAISNWDVSRVHTFDYMFSNAINFSQDISSWNVGNATNMSFMFESADAFNIDISGWNVSNATNMTHMFAYTNLFNQDLNTWDVSSVLNFNQMFKGAGGFNGDISGWNFSTAPSNNITMSYMFQSSNFNRNINTWNVSHVTSMNGMFYQAQTFNQDLSGWDVSSVTTMAGMFRGAKEFNQDLSLWNVINVTDMLEMFYGASFNSPLNWGSKTANVTDMSSMFQSATVFNQNIDGWDLSKVTTTSRMFYLATSFNQDLNSWDVTRVTNAGQMFRLATAFNGNISSWRFTTDLTKYISMASIFADASSFNQDLSAWNVERVNQMQRMFQGTPFNQDISAWDISNVANFQLFLSGGKLSRANYDKLLVGWSTLDAGETKIPINLSNVDFGSSKYSNAPTVLTARNTELISSKGWTITDGGMDDDVVLPEIVGHVLAADNASLSVSFSENVYRTDLGKGTLEITDFLFSLSGGTATLNTTIPTSISTSDNLTFILGIGIDGTPNGAEALTVTPVLDAIFDVSGNIAATSQNNNTTQLNDSTAPVITGPGSETGGNSVLTMNENTTAVHTFSADGMVTWSLGSSNDEALFGMDSSGNLVFTTAPDYETPSSILNSNTYVVEVIATDAANNSTTQSLSITVADIPKTTFGTFSPITKQYFAGPYTIVPPTTNNSNPIVYASDNTAVATLSGTVISFTGIGAATITATQAADANYEGGTVSTLLSVLGKDLVSKYGGVSSTASTFADANGKTGGALGLDKYGGIQNPYEDLVTSGLILHLDAGNPASYSGTGTTWTDISGNGNDGTLVNNVGYTSANNGALTFDGVNDYFVTNNNLDLSSIDELSIQIILKTATTGEEMIIEHSVNWNANNSFGVLQNSNKIQFTDKNQGYNVRTSVAEINDNNWHLFSATTDRSLNATDQTLIYIDADTPNSEIVPTLDTDNSGNFSSHKLYIASRAGSSYHFNGTIAQVLIYNRALTTEEIQQNYNTVKSIYGL